MNSNRQHLLYVVLILLVGLGLRLYRINLPLLDAKPHREIHTAEVTRNFYWHDFNVFYTKTKLWGDEPGYYVLEFPLYNALAVAPYAVFGHVDETWGKGISVFSSLVLAIYFYLLVTRLFNKKVALWALAFFYLFSPQEIMLSRSFQPDQFGLMLAVASLYYFVRWTQEETVRYHVYSFLLLTVTLLVKVQFFPVTFAMMLLAIRKWKLHAFRNPLLLLYTFSLLPTLLWFYHVRMVYLQFPQLNGAHMLSVQNWSALENFINPHWYVNIFYDFTTQITTIPVFILACIGLFLKNRKNYQVIYAWMLGLFLFVLTYSVHIFFWYYQVPLLFPVVLLAAHAQEAIVLRLHSVLLFPRLVVLMVVLLSMVLTARPYLLRTYTIPDKHEYVLETARYVRQLATAHSKIITSSYNSAALTYYSLRPDLWGATFVINDPTCLGKCAIAEFEKLRGWGATLYAISDKRELTQNVDFANYLTRFKPLVDNEHFIVYDIH